MSKSTKLGWSLAFMFFSACTFFEQNDLVVSETISSGKSQRVCYSVYQTGIDNYRFEFMAINKDDTMELFEYYLNDAVYTAMTFRVKETDDTLKIVTNYPANLKASTANGTVIFLSDY